MTRYQNILDTIGETPLVRLNKLAPEGRNVYVKIESFNPMGSVKDRMALAVIEHAEQTGALAPGQTVIEATSGNTGIGLAMVCARKGYPLVVTMAESNSIERRKLLRFLGAKVVLTPAAEKGTGMLNKAIELADAHGWYLCRQFENEVNADVHTRTTAQEILRDMGDDELHYFVSGFGTGGTLKGVARGLKARNRAIRVVAAEPDNAPILGSGIPQPRDANGKPSASHPLFRPHLMQGWSPDFISSLTESAMNEGLVDEVMGVSGEDALRLSRELARREGIFVGISSGATLAAALKLAEREPEGTNIVCMLTDTGERYLSTPLFSDITEEMTDEEIALSESTPGYRFCTQACSLPASDTNEVDPETANYVSELIEREPVVLFALEWCEFCWSVRKLFERMGIAYTSVDLDSVALQEDGQGGRIRAVLRERTGSPTIPQVFVGGRLVGGSTDLFNEFRQRTLQAELTRLGVSFQDIDIDPESLLPNWIQPRTAA